MEALRPEFRDRITFVLVDLSTYEGQAFARQYQVGETTLVLFDATGSVRDIRHGVATEAALRQYLAHVFPESITLDRGRGR